MSSSVHLYQIQYDDFTYSSDSLVTSFDCRQHPEFLKRETAHMIRFYDDVISNDKYSETELFGLLSPKFGEKTGLSAMNVLEFINDNSGSDLYLFNPYPLHVYFHMNVFEQAELRHEGVKQLIMKMFDYAHVTFDVNSVHRTDVLSTVYCNYWVATKSFWHEVIMFFKRLDFAIETMPEGLRSLYFANTNYVTDACFYPFIFERMLSTYLIKSPNHFQVKAFLPNALPNYFSRTDKVVYQKWGRVLYEWEKNTSPDLKILQDVTSTLYLICNPRMGNKPKFFLLKPFYNLIRSFKKRYALLLLPKKMAAFGILKGK